MEWVVAGSRVIRGLLTLCWLGAGGSICKSNELKRIAVEVLSFLNSFLPMESGIQRVISMAVAKID